MRIGQGAGEAQMSSSSMGRRLYRRQDYLGGAFLSSDAPLAFKLIKFMGDCTEFTLRNFTSSLK
jgi:hypothetical protein